MSWELAAWLLLGGSTVLIFLGLPVAFGFLVILASELSCCSVVIVIPLLSKASNDR